MSGDIDNCRYSVDVDFTWVLTMTRLNLQDDCLLSNLILIKNKIWIVNSNVVHKNINIKDILCTSLLN